MDFQNNNLISITDIAVSKLKDLMMDSSNQDSYLLISIGKDSEGLYYNLDFTDTKEDSDSLIVFSGLRVLIQEKDIEQLKDLNIDFIEDEEGGSFLINSPNLDHNHNEGDSCCSCNCGC